MSGRHGDEEQDVVNLPRLIDNENDEEQHDAIPHELNVESTEQGAGTTFRMPVWLRESSSSFQWGWIPLPLRKAGRVTADWVQGPDPPRDLLFQPLFPKFQEMPVKFLDRYAPRKIHKVALLLFVYVIWLLPWFLVILKANTSGNIEGFGRPQVISCVASYWSPGNSCGLNGNDCRPFTSSHFAFRCPANCKSALLYQDRFVGNQTLKYQSLVVGGPEPDSSELGAYRADSFICQAAIHAGVVSDASGGCGVVQLRGAAHSFPSSTRNGITSTSFDSTFPKSFGFISLSGSQATCPADPRWPLLGITAAAVALISIFTVSPGVFYFSTFGLLMFHVGVVSDPPYFSSLSDLFSILLSRLLPASFIAYVLYLYAARPLLQRVSQPAFQLEKTILYVTPAFIGALNNYTFARWIPLQRLTPHDLEQPGAKAALAVVVSIIIVIVLTQAWLIRQAGLMPRYLKVYLSFVAGILFLLALPGLRLRIHHYILAMLLMPGTVVPTRASFIYQGLLLGLFVNGVARWGFASIIETPAALGEDPTAPGGWWGASYPNITNSSVSIHLDSAPIPPMLFTDDTYRGNGNITFDLWERQRMENLGVDGISVLLNDVERWRGYLDEDRKGKFTWRRQGRRGLELIDYDTEKINLQDVDGDDYDNNGVEYDDDSDMLSFTFPDDDDLNFGSLAKRATNKDDDEPQNLFFRFAFLRGSEAGHYGGAGIWLKDGRWIDPPPQQKPDP